MYGYDSRVRLSEVDQDRRMTLNAILNSFQDCSSFHSEDLGVGAAFVEQKKRMWVLSSWKIVIQRYPELAESIRVETSPYEFSKLTGRRNFRMLDGRGEMLACADSLWVYMDAVRKRPCRLEEDVAGLYDGAKTYVYGVRRRPYSDSGGYDSRRTVSGSPMASGR